MDRSTRSRGLNSLIGLTIGLGVGAAVGVAGIVAGKHLGSPAWTLGPMAIAGVGGAALGALLGPTEHLREVTRAEASEESRRAEQGRRERADADATTPDIAIVRASVEADRDLDVLALADAYVGAYDSNHDGSVLLASEVRRQMPSGATWDSSRLFRRADAVGNRDGSVDVAETAAVIEFLDEGRLFQQQLRRGDGTISKGREADNFARVFAEQRASSVRSVSSDLSLIDMSDRTRTLSLLFQQRYDRDFDGKISLENETRAEGHSARELLREADLDDDRAVTLGEIGARLREFDQTFYVGLGDDNRGTDGRIRRNAREGNAELDLA